MEKVIKTIIIGAGISGLSCAKKLQENNEDFLLITENIGGDICTSKDGQINYGAYVIPKDSTFFNTYINKTERINLFNLKFHKDNKAYNYLGLIQYPFELIRLVKLSRNFQKDYINFKKDCEKISQKQAFSKYPFLLDLFKINAKDFIEKNKIKNIVENYLGQVVYMCTFSKLKDLNAFDVMHILKQINIPVYKFSFNKNELTKNFKEKIYIDSVVSIEKQKNIFKIKTKNKEYTATNIILTTPINKTKELLDLGEIRGPCSAYMFHLKGKIKDKYNNKLNLFNEDSDTIFISKEIDNNYLFYSHVETPDFDKYFENYNIIDKKYWKPAFNLKGNILLDAKQDDNLYMIGEYNVCGVEDSFITGLWAANQIINK